MTDPFATDALPQKAAVRPAKLRIRIKGKTDGPIYQGQVQIAPCKTCSSPPSREPAATLPPVTR